jgi:hypothetical protein
MVPSDAVIGYVDPGTAQPKVRVVFAV